MEGRGFAGGIIVAWKTRNISISVLETNFQFIHMQVQVRDSSPWCFTAVYASPVDATWVELWSRLHVLASGMGSWLVAGDFNDIISSEEKKVGAPVNFRRCNIFRDRIS